MSENKVHELHRKLSEKLVEEARAVKKKLDPGVAVRLSQEIVNIRREIHQELLKLRGEKVRDDDIPDVG
ncbi:hypothetical protein JXL21_06895 [Candidatus Bathyarchaeota archaeon]|nr:hypothetical protein [Candidatus Bathyarchaeota archaeon]